jgi:hypothetical protein
MIFPKECKVIGHASTRPCGDRVYFLSRYLIHDTAAGPEILEVETDQGSAGIMRDVTACRVLVPAEDVYQYPSRVQIHNRARLVELAAGTGCRCTLFTGLDEHTTFVLDPDLSVFLKVYVYDVTPPRPSLSACIRELEEAGLFGDLDIVFEHTLRDVSQVTADVYPCRASGFSRTLDADLMLGGETVAGCLTASQFYRECYGNDFTLHDICPLNMVAEEPFIARCCRKEREGTGTWNEKRGAVVHWGAEPFRIYLAVRELVAQWRETC